MIVINMKKSLLSVFILSLITSPFFTYAGTLTPPGSPAVTSYTLSDIYNRIVTNATATEGDHPFAATTTPQPTYRSLTEIYNAIPTIDPDTILSNTTYLGVTGTIEVKSEVDDNDVVLSSTSTNKIHLIPPQGYYNGVAKVSTTSTNFVPGNIKNGVNIFGVTGNLSAGGSVSAQLLQTNQTLCFDTFGDPMSCAGSGQDGEYQEGYARTFTDNADGTITDNATGLMWKKCEEGLSGTNCEVGGSVYDQYMTWTAGRNLCEADTTAGHADWRLPNVLELISIFDWTATDSPQINGTYFPNTAADRYWSGTFNVHSTNFSYPLVVDYNLANTNTLVVESGDGNSNFVRCVRTNS